MDRVPGRHLRVGAFVMACLACIPGSLWAQSQSEYGGTGVFRLQSADLPEQTTLGFGLYNRILNTDSKLLSSLIEGGAVTMADSSQAREPAHLWALSDVLAASISTHRWFEANLAVPVYTQFLNWELGHIDAVALGDVSYGVKLALPIRDGHFPLAVALLFSGTFPTAWLGLPVPMRLEYFPQSPGEQVSESHAIGTVGNDWNLGGAATLDLAQTSVAWPTLVHFNTGVRKTGASSAAAATSTMSSTRARVSRIGFRRTCRGWVSIGMRTAWKRRMAIPCSMMSPSV